MNSKDKKLYLSKKNKKVCGVLGGLGEYLDVDPTVIRLGFVFLLFITAVVPLVVGYCVACFIIPKDPN